MPEPRGFPGLEAGDRVDIEELASAHRAAVADRGYRLPITHENSSGLLVAAFRWHHSEQVVTVTASTNSRVSLRLRSAGTWFRPARGSTGSKPGGTRGTSS